MDAELSAIFAKAELQASAWGHAGAAFEHVVLALLENARGRQIFSAVGADVDLLLRDLRPLVRHVAVRERPDLSPWIAALTQQSALRGFATLTIDELAAEAMGTTGSAVIGQILKQGVRRVDVLCFVAHGITKVTGAALLPTARVLRGSPATTTSKGNYRVVVHNDSYTTKSQAIAILIKQFDKSQAEATEIAERVHRDGRGVAGVYALKLASKRLAKATQTAQDAGCPLLFSLEPDDR